MQNVGVLQRIWLYQIIGGMLLTGVTDVSKYHNVGIWGVD